MRLLFPVIRNNASLMIGPGSAFGTYLVLAKWSSSSVDDLYFFLMAVFSLCAVIDGGLPYRGGARLFTPGLAVRLTRRILNNVLWCMPALGVVLFALIRHSPYGKENGWLGSFFFSIVGLLAIFFKVQADALRVVTYKSKHRMRAETITSTFAVVRLLLAILCANRFPFLVLYLGCVIGEFLVFSRQHQVLVRMAVMPRFRRLRRPQFDLSYLRANIAYNLAYSADRIIALYLLPSNTYRLLVGVTSLYNMSILPHKLSENEALFPSSLSAHAGSQTVPAVLSGVGAAALCGGLVWLLPRTFVTPWYLALSVTWVAATTVYNHSWASALRNFKISQLSMLTSVACAVSLIGVAALHTGYMQILPVALLIYGAGSWAGAAVLKQCSSRDSGRYVAFCALASLPVMLVWWAAIRTAQG